MSAVLPVMDFTGGRRVTTLPHRFAVSPQGEYAHLPRSASWYPSLSGSGPDRLCVAALCGVHLNSPILTDDPAGPVCATCHGRSVGVDPLAPGYAYRPRGIHSLPKRWCKGSDYRLYVRVGDGDARCLLCGTTTRLRGGYGWNGYPTIKRHWHNGCGAGCPDHGLRSVVVHDGRLLCAMHVRSGARCGQHVRPFWILSPASSPLEGTQA
jgi:hypothetical protein